MAMLDSILAQILLYLLQGIVIPLLPHYSFIILILRCSFTFCFSQWLNVMKVGLVWFVSVPGLIIYHLS